MMKTACPSVVAALIFGQSPLLIAQNLPVDAKPSATVTLEESLDGADAARFAPTGSLGSPYQVPIHPTAAATPVEEGLGFVAQDAQTRHPAISRSATVESVVDLSVLREPSPYRRMFVSSVGSPEDFSGHLQRSLAEVSAVYRPEGMAAANEADCPAVALSVEKRIQLDPAKALEAIESEVRANPACACEIIKAAITATDADVQLVTRITEVAITAAPEQMRLIAQCAIASMPSALADIQALLAQLDPGRGESYTGSKSGAKDVSAKGAKVVITPPPAVLWGDPLDLPPAIPPIIPLPVFPPAVTTP